MTSNQQSRKQSTTQIARAESDQKKLKADQQQLRQFLLQGKDQIEAALDKIMDADRMIRLTLTAAVNNPKIHECTMASVANSILKGGAVGLEPNGWDGHLVPYKIKGVMTCTFMPDYKGLAKLAYRWRNDLHIRCEVVYENDDFDCEFGTKEHLHHKPWYLRGHKEPGEMLMAYALTALPHAAPNFTVMPAVEIMKRRAMAQTTNIWDKWPDQQWRKTAFKNHAKLAAAMGDRCNQAITLDNETEAGVVTVPTGKRITDSPINELLDGGNPDATPKLPVRIITTHPPEQITTSLATDQKKDDESPTLVGDEGAIAEEISSMDPGDAMNLIEKRQSEGAINAFQFAKLKKFVIGWESSDQLP